MLLSPDLNLTLRPMQYPQFFQLYKDSIKNIWTTEEIDFSDPDGTADATIARARFLGDVVEYTVVVGGGSLTVRTASDRFHTEGATVGLSFARATPVFLSE